MTMIERRKRTRVHVCLRQSSSTSVDPLTLRVRGRSRPFLFLQTRCQSWSSIASHLDSEQSTWLKKNITLKRGDKTDRNRTERRGMDRKRRKWHRGLSLFLSDWVRPIASYWLSEGAQGQRKEPRQETMWGMEEDSATCKFLIIISSSFFVCSSPSSSNRSWHPGAMQTFARLKRRRAPDFESKKLTI